MWTSTSARDTLVLFNTSHKHNKITRSGQARCPRDPRLRAAGLWWRAHSPRLRLLCLFCGRRRSPRPCRGGLYSRRRREYLLLHDAHVDGSSLPHPRPRRPLMTGNLHHAGATLSYSRRQPSLCTMTLPRTRKYGKRQARTSTDGRSACTYIVPLAVH